MDKLPSNPDDEIKVMPSDIGVVVQPTNCHSPKGTLVEESNLATDDTDDQDDTLTIP